jgi:hypothetical protein
MLSKKSFEKGRLATLTERGQFIKQRHRRSAKPLEK